MTTSETISRYIEWHEGPPPKEGGRSYMVMVREWKLWGPIHYVTFLYWYQVLNAWSEDFADEDILAWANHPSEDFPTRFLK